MEVARTMVLPTMRSPPYACISLTLTSTSTLFYPRSLAIVLLWSVYLW